MKDNNDVNYFKASAMCVTAKDFWFRRVHNVAHHLFLLSIIPLFISNANTNSSMSNIEEDDYESVLLIIRECYGNGSSPSLFRKQKTDPPLFSHRDTDSR